MEENRHYKSCKEIEPGLVVFKSNKSFHLIQKSVIKLNDKDKVLYVAFIPEEGVVDSCYHFSLNYFIK